MKPTDKINLALAAGSLIYSLFQNRRANSREDNLTFIRKHRKPKLKTVSTNTAVILKFKKP